MVKGSVTRKILGFRYIAFVINTLYRPLLSRQYINDNHRNTRVLILDGGSEHGAHIWGKSGISRFVKGILLQRQSQQIHFFSQKIPILLHTCATCSELPSYICIMHKRTKK